VPGSGIDWGMVGLFQITAVPKLGGRALSVMMNKYAPHGAVAIVHKSVLGQYKDYYGAHLLEANVNPAQLGNSLMLLLQEKGPQLVAEAKKQTLFKLLAKVKNNGGDSGGSGSGSSQPVAQTAVKATAIVGAGWLAWKYLLPLLKVIK
jgi:hypothetical protein